MRLTAREPIGGVIQPVIVTVDTEDDWQPGCASVALFGTVAYASPVGLRVLAVILTAAADEMERREARRGANHG